MISNLCELEVNLATRDIRFDDFDGNCVSECVFVNIADFGYMQQSFASGVIELDKESEVGNAGHVSGHYLAYMIIDPHGLEEFDGVSFGLRGFLFASGTMLAHEFEFFAGERLFFAGKDILLHEAVDHQIRIAADGRSEMGIMGESESVMADIIGRIDGFGLGSDGQNVYRALESFGRTAGIAGGSGFSTFRLFLEGLHFGEFVGIGQVMHTIDERSAGPDRGSHHAVSEEHKLLDEMVRLVGRFEVNIRRMAFVVEMKAHLVLLDSERAVGYSGCTEFGSKGVEDVDCLV